MNIFTWISYFAFAMILFFILNYFDKKSEDGNIIHILLPWVYLVIIGGIFINLGLRSWNESLYFIVVMELLIRLYYVKSVLKRESLVNNQYYFKLYLVILIGSYFLVSSFISKVDTVFLEPEEMRMGIWFLIAMFGYFLLKDHSKIEIKREQATFIEKRQEYALMQYAKFKNEFGSSISIKTKNTTLRSLLFAVMIYENYKRPPVFRRLDLIRYRFQGKEMKMGIMQVNSSIEIDDIKSIKLTTSKVEKLYQQRKEENSKIKENEAITKVIGDLYEDSIYQKDIFDIYQTILGFDAK